MVLPLSPLRVERFVALLRAFGLVAGLCLTLLSDFPERSLEVVALLTLGTIVVAGPAIWWWGERTAWRDARVVDVGFALDVLLIFGYAAAFAHIQSNVSWCVAFTVLADATMRYGSVGAVIGYLLGAGVYVTQAFVHEEITGEPVKAVGYAFVLTTLFGVAGVLGLFSLLLGRRAEVQRKQAIALADALE